MVGAFKQPQCTRIRLCWETAVFASLPKAKPWRQQHQVTATTVDPLHADEIFMNPFPNLLFATPHIPPPRPWIKRFPLKQAL